MKGQFGKHCVMTHVELKRAPRLKQE